MSSSSRGLCPSSLRTDTPLLYKPATASTWPVTFIGITVATAVCVVIVLQPCHTLAVSLWGSVASNQRVTSTPSIHMSPLAIRQTRFATAVQHAPHSHNAESDPITQEVHQEISHSPLRIGLHLVALTAVITAFHAITKSMTSAVQTQGKPKTPTLSPTNPSTNQPSIAARAALLLSLQEEAGRHRIIAEEQGVRNLSADIQRFMDIKQGKGVRAAQVSAAVGALPFVSPAAAQAAEGAVTGVTPGLVAGAMASVWMVSQGQYVMQMDGGVSHGPPEPPHPVEIPEPPYPDTDDGRALAEVFAEPYDIWRESFIRYVAFASELGESFRPLVGDVIANGSYAIAIAYVFADSIDKVFRASEVSRELSAAAVFLQMDRILNGRLESWELHAAAKSVFAPLTPEDMDAFLKRADIRGDGSLDFGEFYLALKRRDPTLIRFLEAGALALPRDAARPWRKALSESVDLTDVRTAVAGMDALLWQLMASIAMPGFTLNRIVTLATAICAALKVSFAGAVDPMMLEVLSYIPTIVGLLSITIIVHPLDALADAVFDMTIRKHVFKKAPVDRNGQLTVEMINERLAKQPDRPTLPQDLMQRLLNDVDTDGDGYISLSEWHRTGYGLYERYVKALLWRPPPNLNDNIWGEPGNRPMDEEPSIVGGRLPASTQQRIGSPPRESPTVVP